MTNLPERIFAHEGNESVEYIRVDLAEHASNETGNAGKPLPNDPNNVPENENIQLAAFAPAEPVTVKPLEWGKTSYGAPEAFSVVGVYRINEAVNGGYAVVFGGLRGRALSGPDGRTNFADLDGAKDAAQAHFGQAINSALVKAPAPADASALSNALAKFAESRSNNLGFHSKVYGDDDDEPTHDKWVIWQESGPINDREWDVLAAAESPAAALLALVGDAPAPAVPDGWKEAVAPFASLIPDALDDGYEDDDLIRLVGHFGIIDTLHVRDFRRLARAASPSQPQAGDGE